jgi:prevent-host-death family protein
MHEAKTNFSKLVKRAAAGDEIIVAKSGDPIAKIVAYSAPQVSRTPGMLAGKIRIKPGFDDTPPGFGDAFDA